MSPGPSAAPAGCTPHHRRHRPRTVTLCVVLRPCIMRRSGSPTAAPLRTNRLHKDPSAAPPPAVGVRGSVCVMPSFLGWSWLPCHLHRLPGRAKSGPRWLGRWAASDGWKGGGLEPCPAFGAGATGFPLSFGETGWMYAWCAVKTSTWWCATHYRDHGALADARSCRTTT